MIWTVDRIEEGIAVIETPRGMIKIDLKHLPQGIKEGSKLVLDIDKKEEDETRERIKGKMNRLFKD